MTTIFKILILINAIFFNVVLFSQDNNCNIKKNWFFGRGLTPGGISTGEIMHLQFQCPGGGFVSALPMSNVIPYGVHGGAIINSMNDGSWQLYSDGENMVYSDLSSVNGLEGHPSSTQSIAIAPINVCPVDSFLYFFNTTGIGNAGYISYALGNSTGSLSPQGDLPIPSTSQIGNANNLKHGEGMLLIPHPVNIGSYWLITRLIKNNGADATDAFVVYNVSSAGVSIHQIFDMNTDGNSNISNSLLATANTNFTFSLTRKELAIADGNTTKSIFTIPFDPDTGNFSGSIEHIISVGNLGAYDTEYSPNSQFLYYSVYSTGEVFSYDLNTQVSTSIFQASAGPIKRAGGLGTGPDGNIYALTMSTADWTSFDSDLWQIIDPNNPAPVLTPFANFDNWLCTNLPSFVVLHDFELFSDLSINSVCPNDSLKIAYKTDFSSLTSTDFIWYKDGVVIPGATDSVFWVQTPGVYTLEVSFLEGCTYESHPFEVIPALDLGITLTSFFCNTNTVEIEICNGSDTSFNGMIDLSFYDNDPLLPNTNLVLTQQLAVSIDSNNCQLYPISIPLVSGPLYVVLNDPGTLPLPLSLTSFPLNGIEECDYENNISHIDVVCCPDDLATVDIDFCENEANIDLICNPLNNGVINWYTDNSYTQLIGTGHLFSPINAIGTFTIYVSETSTYCEVRDSITYTIKPLPTVDAGLNTSICTNESTILSGSSSNATIFSWNNGVINGQSFTPLVAQMYTVTANLNSCYATDSIYIDLLPIPSISSNLSETICEGDSVLITLNNPDNATISWSSDISEGSYLIPPIGSTTYTVNAELNGCLNTYTFQINVDMQPILNLSSNIVICQGMEIILSGSSQPSFPLLWNENVNSDIPFFPNLGSTYYTATAGNIGCSTSDSVLVTVNPNPEFNVVTVAPNDCNQTLGSIEFIEDNQGFGPYLVNSSNGVSSSLVYDSLNYGSHSFTITDNNGCLYSNEIIFSDPPNLSYEAQFNYFPKEVTNLNPTVTFENLTNGAIGSYWYNSYTNELSHTEDYSITFPDTQGAYDVCLVADFGENCLDTTCVHINVNEELLLFVPNAFTPNDGNLNNRFTPIFNNPSNITYYSLIIFNRWGETMFESYNQAIGWNGEYAGNKAQDGIYIWQINYKTNESNTTHTKKGHLTLLR